jgi:hypothetical protein
MLLEQAIRVIELGKLIMLAWGVLAGRSVRSVAVFE